MEKERINVAEILRNCQSAKCVIFPKDKTSWEGFVLPLKYEDGNILAYEPCPGILTIYVYRKHSAFNTSYYVALSELNGFMINENVDGALDAYNKTARFATKEEKKRLFDAIKKNGYRWNAETKILERLIVPKFKVGDVIQDKDSYKVKIIDVYVEDEMYGYESVIVKGIGGIGFDRQDEWELVPDKFDINTLVPFESRVLVRNSKTGIWKPAIWGFYPGETDYYYCVLGGICWLNCIPYEGNEHLMGKNDDCSEYFKTWKK